MQDGTAFIELYQAQYPRVVANARRRLGTLSDAEDCAAEVFRLAWERDAAPSVGWVFVTARNIVYALRRSSLRLSELVVRIAREENMKVVGNPTGLLDALDRLPEADRELLVASSRGTTVPTGSSQRFMNHLDHHHTGFRWQYSSLLG